MDPTCGNTREIFAVSFGDASLLGLLEQIKRWASEYEHMVTIWTIDISQQYDDWGCVIYYYKYGVA